MFYLNTFFGGGGNFFVNTWTFIAALQASKDTPELFHQALVSLSQICIVSIAELSATLRIFEKVNEQEIATEPGNSTDPQSTSLLSVK